MAKGGKTLNDRKLAANVRTLGLRMIERILKSKDEPYKKELLLKLTPTLLPRINEHTGLDGKDLSIVITRESAKRFNVSATSNTK